MKHFEMLKEYYLFYLKTSGYAKKTIINYRSSIELYIAYLRKEKIENINDVRPENILNFLVYLKNSPSGRNRHKHYEMTSIAAIIRCLRGFYKRLLKDSYILRNPLSGLDLEIKLYKKSREAKSADEISRLLETVTGSDIYSVRDRAIFETLYGTGMRVGELCALKVEDVDLNQAQIRVREPKNRYERYVPLGKRVQKYLAVYVKKARAEYVRKADREIKEYFFFSDTFSRFNAPGINKRLRLYIEKAGLEDFTCHVLRHSFATHMLHGGAEISHVKKLLGHRHIGSTVIYTHFDVNSLRKIIKMYHPRENELYEEFNEKDYEKFRDTLKN